MRYGLTIPAVALCLLLQAACSNHAVYSGERFADDSPYKRRFDGDAVLACESARRSLLGEGYLIEGASGEGVKGRKASKSDNAQNTFIEVNVVCLPDNTGSTLFASAQVSEYALKKSSSAASVGVSALGSISLPIGQSADSLVKVKEVTIDDKDFYQRFFTAVGKTILEMQERKAMSPAATKTAEPELAPAPAPEPLPAPSPVPTAVVTSAPPPVPAALPEVVSEPRPVLEDATATVQAPLQEPPVPTSVAEPLHGVAAPAAGPDSPAQQVPAADAPELLPEKAPSVQAQKPISDDEDSGIPQEQVTLQGNPKTVSSLPPLSPKTPVTAPDQDQEPESTPKASQISEEPTDIPPQSVPDPLIQELF